MLSSSKNCLVNSYSIFLVLIKLFFLFETILSICFLISVLGWINIFLKSNGCTKKIKKK
jgi:hypothetical protein